MLVNQPIFLVGAPRSGTTMLRLMLDHHPAIAFEHEFDQVVEQLSDAGVFPEVGCFVQWLKTVRGFHYQVDARLDYLALVNSFLRQKQEQSGWKPHVGATIHLHFHRLRYLWPEARYIHLLRDPRDVARSVMEKQWAGNLYMGARFWQEAEHCWDLLAGHLRSDQAIEVRYEDLVANPEAELTRICRFIGVEFAAAMLDYSETAIQYPKPNPKLANQWQRKSSTNEVQQVELQVGELMKRRGYEPIYPDIKASVLNRRRLTFDSKVKCLGFRMKKIGLRLLISDILARRLGFHSWQRTIGERINDLEDKSLQMEAAGKAAPSQNIDPVELGNSRA